MKTHRTWLYVLVLFSLAATAVAQVRAQIIQSDELETFLQKARISRGNDIALGVTLPKRLTLELNGEKHLAAFKSIDEFAAVKKTDGGTEASFQDSYMTEIAAYEVDKIIGLGMVPTTVERSFEAKRGSVQIWVDSIMDEGARFQKKIEPPNPSGWNDQWQKMQLFDNLIYNVDRNRGNILINKDWEIILIDHSRSFRSWDRLMDPKSVTRFSRSFLKGIGRLNENNLKEKTAKYLSNDQRKGVLKRRDLILDLAKKAVAARGEAAVLFP